MTDSLTPTHPSEVATGLMTRPGPVSVLSAQPVCVVKVGGSEGVNLAAIVEDGRTKILRDDYTGTVDVVNVALLRVLLEAGYTPVVSPPAISTGNEPINVDADRAAARTAAALCASSLLLLSNVRGLLKAF